MKEVVKKVLESGLVDKHVAALMEKWGTLDAGASELVGKEDVRNMSKEQLEKFAEDLDGLLEKERETFRETRLDIQVKKMRAIRLINSRHSTVVPVVEDELGRLILQDLEVRTVRGDRVEDQKTGEQGLLIDYETLYRGEAPYALQLTIDWEQN